MMVDSVDFSMILEMFVLFCLFIGVEWLMIRWISSLLLCRKMLVGVLVVLIWFVNFVLLCSVGISVLFVIDIVLIFV